MDFKTKRSIPVAEIKRPASVMDNQEFRRWFEKSKVVDQFGQPIVMHHGTNHEFTEFQTQSGAWFTSNCEITQDYGTKNRMDVYLSIKDPYRSSHQENVKLGALRLVEKAKRLGHDGIHLPRDVAMFEEYVYYEANSDVWVAFSPTQIKSATANDGSFEPGNPDITK